MIDTGLLRQDSHRPPAPAHRDGDGGGVLRARKPAAAGDGAHGERYVYDGVGRVGRGSGLGGVTN
jgi:hypothetical protein